MHQDLCKRMGMRLSLAVLGIVLLGAPAWAQTQEVNRMGLDGHLVFGYWNTQNYTDTHLSITSPLGVRTGSEASNVVEIALKDRMGTGLGSFRICLKPGDTWTATLTGMMEGEDTMSSLMVGNPGSCDDTLAAMPANRDNPPLATPGPDDDPIMLAAGDGFLTAYVMPTDALEGDDGAVDAVARPISGMATLVSPMSGFASSYAALALKCRAATDEATVAGNETVIPAKCTDDQINMALRANHDLMMGRWTAIDDENVSTRTTLIVTFPGTHSLAYEAHEKDVRNSDIISGIDPVSLYVFGEVGAPAWNFHEVMLGDAVNMCEFLPVDGGSSLQCGDDMLSAAMPADSGSFRFVNNTAWLTADGSRPATDVANSALSDEKCT